MAKLGTCLACVKYTLKKQFPIIGEFKERMCEVEKELNKQNKKKKSMDKNTRKSRQNP